MELTPIKRYEHEVDESGIISILIPRFKSERMARIFVPKKKSKFFKVKLDELGSGVWLEVNGQKNVHKICTILTEKFGEKIHPAEDRVVKFLSTLYLQRCIAFKDFQKK